jgi:hypothetical protein
LIIRDLGSASRRKVLAQDATAMMRVLVMALVLNEQETFSARDYGKLRARDEELGVRWPSWRLRT